MEIAKYRVLSPYRKDALLTLERMLRLADLRGYLAPQITTVAKDPRILHARRIWLTGSGDSLFAAEATEAAMMRWSGIIVRAISAMEFARYQAPMLQEGDVVMAISNGGRSTRVREAICLARAAGVPTVAVTGSQDDPLKRAADFHLHRPVSDDSFLPASYGRCFLNMAEYLATLYSLYAFGLELGAQNGRLTDRSTTVWHQRISNAIGQIGPTIEVVEGEAQRMARALASIDTIWILGAGPGKGAARYAAAKFHEQMPLNGIAEDLEEWAHLQYFLTLSRAGNAVVMVMASPGNALDRAMEIVAGIKSAGGRVAVVTAPGIDGFEAADFRFDVPDVGTEWLSPLLYHLPAQLLVLHLSRTANAGSIPLIRSDDGWLIRQGLMHRDLQGLM